MSQTRKEAYRIYIIFNFVWSFSLSLAFTLNLVYLVTQLGVDALQMVLVGTVLELSAFIFEVPTGVVADRYSRRLSIIIGVMLMGLSFFVFIVPSFLVVLLSQVILGLGWTFISGANSAWLADEIGEEHAANAYLRANQVNQIASVIGLLVSVALGLLDMRLPIISAGICLLLLGIYLKLSMPETGFSPQPKQERGSMHSMIVTTREGLAVIRRAPVLVTLLAAILLWGTFSEVYDRLWTLHIIDNFDLSGLGSIDLVIWFGIIGLMGLPINLATTEYVRRRITLTDPIAIAQNLVNITLILALTLPVLALTQQFLIALVALWAINAMRGLTYPLREAWLNQGLKPQLRATVLSMAGQADALGQIAGGPPLGWLAQRAGVRLVLTAATLLLLPIIGLYQHTIRQHGRIKVGPVDI